MSDTITMAQFKVDLADLHDAIGTVQKAATAIDADCQTIVAQYAAIEAAWVSPAGTSFTEMSSILSNTMDMLVDLLADTVQRMQQSYDNYVEVEQANTQNVS